MIIRTAIPFGYLFIALFFLTAFVAGAVTFIVGLRRHSKGMRWAGAALCASVTLVAIVNVAYSSALEWNPIIDGDAQILGTWSDRDQTLILAADHTFTYQDSEQVARGTWSRDDFNLKLGAGYFSEKMRFVQVGGTYRLMTHPPDDPDVWDGDLGLRLTKP